jgi:hypothetical protein
MTAKELNNSFNNPNTEYLTEITLKVRVPLHMEDIRKFVHMVDEDASGPGEGIAPAEVSASDFVAFWLLGEYTGNVEIVEDEMELIKKG